MTQTYLESNCLHKNNRLQFIILVLRRMEKNYKQSAKKKINQI